MSDVNSIIADFANAAINNGKAQEDGNANQANTYYSVIEKKQNGLLTTMRFAIRSSCNFLIMKMTT